MRYAPTLPPNCSFRRAAIIAMLFFIVSACAAQAPAADQPEVPWLKDLKKYPGLTEEFGRFIETLQHNLQFPPSRGPSRLLPLLPQTTVFYAAFPNYGDVAHQTLKVFHEQLKERAVLRDWWQQGELAASGPKMEDALEKAYQFSQFLGDEIVMSGASAGREPSFLLLAEVRKPGLKEFLQQRVKEVAGKSKPGVRVLDLRELATVEDRRPSQELLVLVRSDYVAAASDAATLRSFNARLEKNNQEFVSTAFGQRVAQAYEGGASLLAAVDLQKIMAQVPPAAKQDPTFQRTGFGDVKYLVWEHKGVPGQPGSQMELSFTGPRRGVASWLAAPTSLGSLNFVSPKAVVAVSVVLRSPAQIFEDVKEIASASNPNALAPITQMEAALQLDLKEDLLRLLGGEITFELDDPSPQEPVWKAILRVNDASRLQLSLAKLLQATHAAVEQFEQGGVTYHAVQVPSQKRPSEVGYAFVDGYLILGSSREAVAEAVRLHQSGESLGKSKKFLASLPAGHSPEASALLYQDPLAMMVQRMRAASPEMADSLKQLTGKSEPAVVAVYGEERAIRQVSTNAMLDAGAVMVVAAIAIPNLLRSRIAANEASAVGTIRTVNVAQVTYAATYPDKGFAPDLATLGPGPGGPRALSEDHAGLVDTTLFEGSCTAGAWCTKSGFRFSVKAACLQQQCGQYVVVGTPVASNTGGRSFCSTSDGVVRFKAGPPLDSPVGVSECKRWTPLQ